MYHSEVGFGSLPNEVCVDLMLFLLQKYSFRETMFCISYHGIMTDRKQIIEQVLNPFPTRDLLHFVTVSRHVHLVILRIMRQRLLSAARIRAHELVLECFHPTKKWSTPGHTCEYLKTDVLSDLAEGEGLDETTTTGGFGQLAGLYSHFRPQEADRPQRIRPRHPAGDVPGHPNTSSAQDHFDLPQIPSQDVHLDSFERFSQLVTVANIVKKGPRAGLFLSCVTVGEGVIRVFRDWLAEHAVSSKDVDCSKAVDNNEDTDLSTETQNDDRVLWLDDDKNIGVKLRVIKRDEPGGPILQRHDEDPAVSYTLKYEGEYGSKLLTIS